MITARREGVAQPRTSDDALSNPVLATFVRDLREALGAQLREVWLFGSRARGESNVESDYDVCVVVDANPEQAERVVSAESYEILDRYEDLISGPVYDLEEWERSLNTPLGWNIRKEGMRLL
jgi:predicted nucleotidyltransferase